MLHESKLNNDLFLPDEIQNEYRKGHGEEVERKKNINKNHVQMVRFHSNEWIWMNKNGAYRFGWATMKRTRFEWKLRNDEWYPRG